MSRPVFSFRPNLDNPEHQKAWQILQNVPDGKKNAFLVRAVLQADSLSYLEQVVRQAVREEIKCGSMTPYATVQADEEIPDQMLDFLGSL